MVQTAGFWVAKMLRDAHGPVSTTLIFLESPRALIALMEEIPLHAKYA